MKVNINKLAIEIVEGRRRFESGVNATITGDMLTTVGNTILEDKAMLTSMGFEI